MCGFLPCRAAWPLDTNTVALLDQTIIKLVIICHDRLGIEDRLHISISSVKSQPCVFFTRTHPIPIPRSKDRVWPASGAGEPCDAACGEKSQRPHRESAPPTETRGGKPQAKQTTYGVRRAVPIGIPFPQAKQTRPRNNQAIGSRSQNIRRLPEIRN